MKNSIVLSVFLTCCTLINAQSVSDSLLMVKNVLENITGATYHLNTKHSTPLGKDDFINYSSSDIFYADPKEVNFGGYAIYDSFNEKNERRRMLYDGRYYINIEYEHSIATVDTIANGRRAPSASFFVKITSLINYSLKHTEHVEIAISNYGDSIEFDFWFNNRIIEFGKSTPFNKEETGKNSHYQIMTDVSFLPFKWLRDMPHQITIDECSNINLLKEKYYKFNALDMVPPHIELISSMEYFKRRMKQNSMKGKMAPDWKLLNVIRGDSIQLYELKSKVVLINFTTKGCFPCEQSVPYLKDLNKKYKKRDVALISIQNNRNIDEMKAYVNEKNVSWPFLVIDKKLRKEYQVDGFPTFFVLDGNKKIVDVIIGYRGEKTEKKIEKLIEEIL